MDAAFATYKAMVEKQPSLDDSWFVAALAQARQGNEEARRRILGSGLRLTLAVAEVLASTRSDLSFWDLIQEANVALTHSLDQFTGSFVKDFVTQVDRDIRSHLLALSK
jgi:DNA-directed RNA polymerase sigma subunit (sigma70/sigma32)